MVPFLRIQIGKRPAGAIRSTVANACSWNGLDPFCTAQDAGVGDFSVLGPCGRLCNGAFVPDMLAGGGDRLRFRLAA